MSFSTRREFVKTTAFASAGLVVAAELGGMAACAPKPLEHEPTQADFVARVKERLKKDGLDLNPNTPIDDIRAFIDMKTFDDKEWMHNENNLGGIQTPRRGFVPIRINDRGEPVPYQIEGFYYPEPPPNLTKFRKETVDPDKGVYIYGTDVTKGMFAAPENKKILDLFARDYFKDSRATQKVLHLNFMPYKKGVKPEGIPQSEWSPRVEELDAAIFTAPDFSAQHVVLNLNKIHANADHFGFKPHQSVIGSLANENVNMIPRSRRKNTTDNENEAPSTIFDLLAQFDPDVAQKILGPNYFPFVLLVEKEMLKLQSMSKKQVVDAFIEKQPSKRRGFLFAPYAILFPPMERVSMVGPTYCYDIHSLPFAV